MQGYLATIREHPLTGDLVEREPRTLQEGARLAPLAVDAFNVRYTAATDSAVTMPEPRVQETLVGVRGFWAGGSTGKRGCPRLCRQVVVPVRAWYRGPGRA